MSMNRCVRVSSKVVLVPSLAATSACTRASGCDASSLKFSSVFANAHASLPVRALIFTGGTTPNFFSNSANLSLDISVSLSATQAASNLSFLFLTSSRCCSSKGKLSSSEGSTNIRSVTSMTFSSDLGNPAPMNILNSLWVKSTSLRQYSPYLAKSSGAKSIRRLPSASLTSVPLTPIAYRSANLANDPPASTPCSARAMHNVSSQPLGVMPKCQLRIAPSNCVLWASTKASFQLNCPNHFAVSSCVPLNHCVCSSFTLTATPITWN